MSIQLFTAPNRVRASPIFVNIKNVIYNSRSDASEGIPTIANDSEHTGSVTNQMLRLFYSYKHGRKLEQNYTHKKKNTMPQAKWVTEQEDQLFE